MVDIDAAVGFVVARGDAVDRARLSHFRTGAIPSSDAYEHVERGQAASGGWPAQWAGDVASIDATCFRLAELDDMSGLGRPAAVRALGWLATKQRLDGAWEESAALAESAPPWARPGDPEARFYLTANASYWLAVVATDAEQAGALLSERPYEDALTRASRSIVDALDESGGWPGFLVSGWLAGAVLHRTQYFYESARIFMALAERVPSMSAADAAWLTLALRRVGVSTEDNLIVAARRRLDEMQRPDGAWPSDDGAAFDVHTTLTALRALR
jgi:hypothetical protein